jgi:hypothetical protein
LPQNSWAALRIFYIRNWAQHGKMQSSRPRSSNHLILNSSLIMMCKHFQVVNFRELLSFWFSESPAISIWLMSLQHTLT